MPTTVPSSGARVGGSRTSSISSSIAILSPPNSFDQLSDDFSDERIVWSGSNSCVLESYDNIGKAMSGDDDFVLLSPSNRSQEIQGGGRSRVNTTGHNRVPSSVSSLSSLDSLVPSMNNLSIGSSASTPPSPNDTSRKRRRSRHRNKPTTPKLDNVSTQHINRIPKKQADTQAKITTPPQLKQRKSVTAIKGTPPLKCSATAADKKPEESLGLGERPIVDDISEYSVEPSFYDNAVQLMGSVLSSPDSITPSSRLEILQALIIELGLVTSEMALPTSLTSARAFLRSHVFVNILDYVAAREKGQEALQQIMHKNRAALVKNLRKRRKNRAPLTWVKESGLSVLLVSCY